MKHLKEPTIIDRLRCYAGKEFNPIFINDLREAARELERLHYQDKWLQGGVYYTNDEYKAHVAEINKLNENLSELLASLKSCANSLSAVISGEGGDGEDAPEVIEARYILTKVTLA